MATDLVAPTISATQDQGAGLRHQFQGLFSEIRPFNFSLLEDSIAAEVGATADVTVAGAAVGDLVIVAPGVDITGCQLTAFVSAANTVTINLYNMEGTDVNTTMAAATVWYGVVLKRNESAWIPLA
jgi:hypothetical protein